MLTVVTPAETCDLVRFNEAREALGLAGGGSDVELKRWIGEASAAIVKFCNRTFAQETVAETFRLESCKPALLLSRFPVVSIASVVENGAALSATDYELASDSGQLMRLSADAPAVWSGKTIVTYVAGHTLDDMPKDIKRAAVLLVNQYRYSTIRDPQLRGNAVEGIGSRSFFDGMGETGMAPEIAGLLADHRMPAGF
jgi:hypothetical protein